MADHNTNPSDFIFDRPTILPTKDLLNPVMVTVKVRENENGESASYTIPRALICTKSEYFSGAFMGEFLE